MNEKFYDEDLGYIVVTRNARSTRLIATRKSDHVQLTVPLLYSIDKIKKAFYEIKHLILDLPVKPAILFNEESDFKSLTFSVNIEKHHLQNYYVNLKNNVLNIGCPLSCDFNDDNVQIKIRSFIETALRAEAKHFFSERIKILAKENGFTYSAVKINKSRTRWGSCSAKKSINISYFCLLLPAHLVDFIILHELCHTLEMNHGEGFWRLLDKVSNNQARQLTQELKTTQISW